MINPSFFGIIQVLDQLLHAHLTVENRLCHTDVTHKIFKVRPTSSEIQVGIEFSQRGRPLGVTVVSISPKLLCYDDNGKKASQEEILNELSASASNLVNFVFERGVTND